MFTGIITDMGRLSVRRSDGDGAVFLIQCRMADEGLVPGESIAVSGVCLTVESAADGAFQVTASPETLRCTRLGQMTNGQAVNLERAVRASDRLGGHLVQGHVDDVGHIRASRQDGVSRVLTVTAPDSVARHVVDRGSVTVDGVSLTITGVNETGFEITLIPATLEQTTLSSLRVGDPVNLEADIISKYLAHHLRILQGDRDTIAPAAWLAATGD